jgi:hypothetical protein
MATKTSTAAKTGTTKKAAPAKAAVKVHYTRNGNAIARDSLSYLAYLEGQPVDKFVASLKRKGVKDPKAPFAEVTLTSGTKVAATAKNA